MNLIIILSKVKFNFIKNTSDNALVNKIFRKYAGKNIDTVSKLDVKENLGFINIFKRAIKTKNPYFLVIKNDVIMCEDFIEKFINLDYPQF